jgi:threonine synthase
MTSWLECAACGRKAGDAPVQVNCGSCSGELRVRYASAGQSGRQEGPGIFRYSSRLPVEDVSNAVTLGEGGTPLVEVVGSMRQRLDLPRVRIKCESANPTGSFKDRIAALAATIMNERDIPGCVGTSSGNGGAAMAAYAARAGRRLIIFGVSDTLLTKMLQITAAGAHLMLLEGLGHDPSATETALREVVNGALEIGYMPFVTATRFMPEAMEGAKTIAYEIAEQAPNATAVYVPIGGGGLFSALWRGYAEIGKSLPNGPPRLIAVQPHGCPTVARMQSGLDAVLDAPVDTTISGLQVAFLFEPLGVKVGLQSSGGHLVEVDDQAVWAAQALLFREEGVFVEPAGATAFAGVLADARDGALSSDDDVVAVATGAGFKDPAALARIAGSLPVPTVRVQDIRSVMRTTLAATSGPHGTTT